MGGTRMNSTPITRGEYDKRETEHRAEFDQIWKAIREEIPQLIHDSEGRIIERIDKAEAQQTKEHAGVTTRLDLAINRIDTIEQAERDEDALKRALILIAKIGTGLLGTLATVTGIAVALIEIFSS